MVGGRVVGGLWEEEKYAEFNVFFMLLFSVASHPCSYFVVFLLSWALGVTHITIQKSSSANRVA